jgi:3-oxoacyl-[acyl-carrier-protein] synthase II
LHDTTDLEVNIGGEVRDLNEGRINVNDLVSTRKMDRASQFAVHAAHEALEDAGLPTKDIGENAAVIIGAGLAGLETYEFQMERMLTKGPSRVSPFTIPMLMPNAPPGNISLAFGARGTCYTTSSACSSSGHSMIDAMEYLRRGDADFVITGGTEASLTRLGISSFVNMKAMNKTMNDRPKESMRPFDADRGGFHHGRRRVCVDLRNGRTPAEAWRQSVGEKFCLAARQAILITWCSPIRKGVRR